MPESDVITEILSAPDPEEITPLRAEELRVSAERMHVFGLARQLPAGEKENAPSCVAGLK